MKQFLGPKGRTSLPPGQEVAEGWEPETPVGGLRTSGSGELAVADSLAVSVSAHFPFHFPYPSHLR